MDIKLVIGLSTGLVQLCIGHPFDTIKTNVQIEQNKSYLLIINKIFKQQGIRGFYKGWQYPFYTSIFLNSIFFNGYDFLKETHRMNSFVNGALMGFLGGFIIQPFEVFKCQLQSNNKIDIRKMFYGLPWTCARETVASSMYFGIYETLKSNQIDNNNSSIISFIKGGIAGISSHLISYPLDTYKTFKNLGIQEKPRFLCRGLTITLIRSFIVNTLNFKIYEKLKEK